MTTTSRQLEELAERIEAMTELDGDLAKSVAATLSGFLPDASDKAPLAPSDVTSTDPLLHLVDELAPGWSIHFRGQALEPDGHWHCTLRASDSSDDDEFIGLAKGPNLSNTLTAALMRVIAYRKRVAT